MEVKHERNSNFEIMRIISMFFIVIWHVMIYGGFIWNSSGITHEIMQLIFCLIIVHVNSFVLITGYFQYEKEFKWSKFWSILKLEWIYKIIIPLILLSFGLISLCKWDFVTISFPFIDYWFIIAYLALYALTPYLNKVIKHSNKKELLILILILLFFNSLIPFITIQDFLANSGYTLISFIYLYLIGAYLHKYGKNSFKKFYKKSISKQRAILLFVFLACALFHFFGWIICDQHIHSENNFIKYISVLLTNEPCNYSLPLVIIQSVAYFLFFSTFNFKCKLINRIAGYTFPIYIIHDNYYLRTNIYKWFNINIINESSTIGCIIVIIVCSLSIFVCSLLIEFLRRQLVKFLSGYKLFKTIKSRCIKSFKLLFKIN